MLFAPRFWYQKSSWLAYLLSPAALIYQLGAKCHRGLYQLRFKKTHQFSLPIIVVGNLTVGGVGKTPLVIWLARWLSSQGFKPGIVSRGYGGVNQLQVVTENSDPEFTGDEAMLLANKTHCPVIVAPHRAQAVEKLITDFDCNIIISDDGLQHYALARDIEIVVMDERKFGNQFCLPAGPLRESLQRLKSVDFIVNNGGANEITADYFNIQLGSLYQIKSPDKKIDLFSLRGKRVHAVAGIGNPSRFFQQLMQAGIEIIPHPFPDHHRYREQDLNFADDLMILMTEKDAVKCRHFANDRYWAVTAELKISPTFQEKLIQKVPQR